MILIVYLIENFLNDSEEQNKIFVQYNTIKTSLKKRNLLALPVF